MSIAKAMSAQLVGLTSEVVTIEIDISTGLNAFSVVGLGDRSVDEAKDRIAAAIKNSGLLSPKQKNQKVVISLAPADMRKEGTIFDLAMALAYLAAVGEISFAPDTKLFLGELSLEGRVRRVSGLLPILCQARSQGFTEAFIPADNSREASLAQGLVLYPVSALTEAIAHLKGDAPIVPLESGVRPRETEIDLSDLDMSVIRGNRAAKRGLEIAAAGAHNVLLNGEPGTGKSMLANSFVTILPGLTYEQSVEVTGIHSAARVLGSDLITRPPFRSPHHTASYPSIVGGGSIPRPGEISLAHRGVLFLDELPEFDRTVIEALRQPLEERTIMISRARGSVVFPAQCILIASMNPCPCGKRQDHGCRCSPHIVEAYRRKLSGPILDRIDIWLHVNAIEYDKLGQAVTDAEPSRKIRKRVERARAIAKARFDAHGIQKSFNSEMNAKDIEQLIKIDQETRLLIVSYARRLDMSGRGFHRICKVAQTIADLAGHPAITKKDALEAFHYRERDLTG